MGTTNLPQSAGLVGVAASATETFVPAAVAGAGSFPVQQEVFTLVDQGAELPAYSLVAIVTATGKVTFCNPSAADGSENPIGITAATAPYVVGEQSVSVIRSGDFNENVVNYDASTTGFADIKAVKTALRTLAPNLVLKAPKTATP